jgi:carbon-monoxide dehydrogenase medium subunit
MSIPQVHQVTDWHRPLPDATFITAQSITEAIALMQAHPGACFIAGGTALVRMGRWGGTIPPTLVYIGRIAELKQIRQEQGRLVIGSLVVARQLAQSPLVRQHAPVLARAAQEIAGPAVSNLATIGGNVVTNWDLVPALLALDAQVHLQDSNGSHVIPLVDFYATQSAQRPDRLIVALSVATDLPRHGYQKIARRQAMARAIIGAAVTMDMDGDICRQIRIGIGGVGLSSRRLPTVEDLLRGNRLTDALMTQAGAEAYAATADAYLAYEATPEYTREMARVMIERAINSAADRPVL